MADVVEMIGAIRVLLCAGEGPQVAGERDANDLMSAAWAQDAAWVAIPVARTTPDFWRLSTRIAGEVIQKFVNHRLQLAFVGDLSPQIAASGALADFVRESNRGDTVWFVADIDELRRRLARGEPL